MTDQRDVRVGVVSFYPLSFTPFYTRWKTVAAQKDVRVFSCIFLKNPSFAAPLLHHFGGGTRPGHFSFALFFSNDQFLCIIFFLIFLHQFTSVCIFLKLFYSSECDCEIYICQIFNQFCLKTLHHKKVISEYSKFVRKYLSFWRSKIFCKKF